MSKAILSCSSQSRWGIRIYTYWRWIYSGDG